MSIEIGEGEKPFELLVHKLNKSSGGVMRLAAGEDEKSDKEKEDKGKEEKKEDSADGKKSDAAKSAVKSADSKDAKVEPKAESQYQNLDAQLPPELKTPVPAEQKPQPMKKKKSNPCCTIL